jgi:hypothetical protein
MVMSMHGHGLQIFRSTISNPSGARSVALAGQCEHERANRRLVSQRGDHGNAARHGILFIVVGVFGSPAAIIALVLFIALALLIFRSAQSEGGGS